MRTFTCRNNQSHANAQPQTHKNTATQSRSHECAKQHNRGKRQVKCNTSLCMTSRTTIDQSDQSYIQNQVTHVHTKTTNKRIEKNNGDDCKSDTTKQQRAEWSIRPCGFGRVFLGIGTFSFVSVSLLLSGDSHGI